MVYKTPESHMANIIKTKLQQDGVDVFMINKMDSAYNNFGGIELYVNEEDIEKAKSIISKAL